jgi:hypothetical protein
MLGICEELLHKIIKRFRAGLVFKPHRLLHHLTLCSSVIRKQEKLDGGLAVRHQAEVQRALRR